MNRVAARIAAARCRCARRSGWLGALLVACSVLQAARADAPAWEAGAGLGVLHLPEYRGSREAHVWVLPAPYLVYRGEFLRADREGARAVLFEGERHQIDLSAWAGPPTRTDGGGVRLGMPALPPTFEIGPRVNLGLVRAPGWRLDLRVPVRAVVAVKSTPRNVGWSAEVLLNADVDLGGWRAGVQGGPLWGDQRWHQHVYGVPAAYATATRPVFNASGGQAGWQATATLSRRIGRWWVGGFVRHDRLAGTVFDASPLLQRRAHTAAGIAFTWIFAVSDRRVPDTADD